MVLCAILAVGPEVVVTKELICQEYTSSYY